jgi:hypothetical protein
MLSNAESKTSSENSLGTILRVLAVLDAVRVDSRLAGRLSVSSHGQTTFSLRPGDLSASGVLLRGIYGSNSTSENMFCSVLKILYSMLMGVSAVKGLTRVKYMRDASLNIWRRCAVVTILRQHHFFLKLRTSRRKIVFSAVNSRDAAQAISGSMLFSMLNSNACIDAFDLSSLLKITVDDLVECIECVEVRDSVSDVDVDRWHGFDLKASRSGMTMSTC